MTMDSRTLAMLAPLLLLLIGLGFTVWVDPYIGRERRRVMLLIAVLSLSLIVQNVLEYRCAVAQPRGNWRTVLNGKKCVGCQVCYNICPVKAIAMVEKKPVIDRKKCIRCFCCQEFCPQSAMVVKRTAIAKLLDR